MDLTIEQKYVFPRLCEDILLEWLHGSCVSDPDFREGSISSIYYDTPCFDFYAEKRGSDYLKTKVRLRWYMDLDAVADEHSVPCYLEIKQKCGVTRQKERVRLNVPSKSLKERAFSCPYLLELPGRMEELGLAFHKFLVPALIVRYYRYRFVDPLSKSRISVDINICCPEANEGCFPFAGPTYLDLGVLEIKGAGSSMPDVLRPMRPYLSREAFSKYGRCIEQLQQPIGVRI